MTKEIALNILHNASVYHPDYLDALNMAIQALEKIEKIEKLIDDWTKMEELEWKIREVLDNENDD